MVHSTQSHLVSFLEEQADAILNIVAPIVWAGLFVQTMDKDAVLELWFMPILGFCAALLANSVPLGGGIVYIPALSLMGANISLGASFTIATMPIGNGLLGFLRWLEKDPSSIVWESFVYTVLPSWIGSFIAVAFFPTPDVGWIKFLFGVFCFAIGVLVCMAIYRGGLRKVVLPESANRVEVAKSSANSAGDAEAAVFDASSTSSSSKDWNLVIGISFLGGLFLVPHIGIGPALVTYVMLSLFGYSEHQARVTGIITGGWVCIAPFLMNIFVFNDVPSQLWLMVLPGVFFGAKVRFRSC